LNEYERPWKLQLDDVPFDVDAPFEQTSATDVIGTSRAAVRYLRQASPDAVLTIGYGSRYLLAFAAACRRLRITSLLWLEHVFDFAGASPIREVVKQAVCRSLFDAVVVPGIRSANYARWVGFNTEQIWRAGNVVDNEHFDVTPRSRRAQKKHFIYVGRLSVEKNLSVLLRAFARYRQCGGNWNLVLVGDGPDADSLKSEAHHIPGVRFAGWANYEEVPHYLERASALVLPSLQETWGLVVNEAMAAGLPVLVSRKCGCYPELCREGANGLAIEPTSESQIAGAFKMMEECSHEQRHSMGQLSQQIIASFTIETWADTLLACVKINMQEAKAKNVGL
jgi:glycosyltransferase involved in cell wall biosynthesis